MKKVLLTLTIAGTIGMSSCSDEAKVEGDEKAEVAGVSLDDMCTCTTEMLELGEKFQEDPENEDLKKEIEAKSIECKEIAEELEVGKTDDEIENLKKDFMESCPVVKEVMGGH